jgi:hypothetical protein
MLAFFKSLVKEHGRQFFEPIGKALQQHQIKNFSPANPLHLWKLRHEMASYAKWSIGQKFQGRDRQTVPNMDRRLADHIAFAQDACPRHARDLSDAMTKHQLKLADRQCRMSELSLRVQDTIVLLVTAQWAHAQKQEITIAAADILCQDIRNKLTGQRPSDRYFKDVSQLADMILAGGFDELSGIPREEILFRYE